MLIRYYCETCDKIFAGTQSIDNVYESVVCPYCGTDCDPIGGNYV